MTKKVGVPSPAPTPTGQPDPIPSAGPTSLIWMLRRTVRSYRAPMAAALAQAGFGDLPQQGIWALSAVTPPTTTAGDLVGRMQISKQAVSQLVDSLVSLGYIGRCADPDDRRRVLLELTGRGHQALAVINATVADVESAVIARMGMDEIQHLRRTLEVFLGP